MLVAFGKVGKVRAVVEQLPQLQRKLQLQLHQIHQSMMDPQVARLLLRTFEAPLIVTLTPAARS